MPSLMNAVNDFSSLLSIGTTLESIFDASNDSAEIIAAMQQMLGNLLAEIKQVFLTDLTDVVVATAAGVAQSAHDFLAVDYVNAQKAGMSKAELWAMLTSDTSVARLSDLVAQASIMLGWSLTDPDMAEQTTSLALAIYLHIFALHQERARNAPDDATSRAEWADAKQYATLAGQRMGPIVTGYLTQRSAAITPITENRRTDRGPENVYILQYIVQDAWPPSQPAGIVLAVGQEWVPDKGGKQSAQLNEQITTAYNLYRNLCCIGGPDAQLTAWSQQLAAAVNGQYFLNEPAVGNDVGNPAPQSGPVIRSLLPSLQATGRWVYNANASLANFATLAGPPALASVEIRFTPMVALLTNASCTFHGGSFPGPIVNRQPPRRPIILPYPQFVMGLAGDGMQMSFVLVAAPSADPVLSLVGNQTPLTGGLVGVQINGAPVPGTLASATTPAGFGHPAHAVVDSVSLPASAFVQGANTVSFALRPNSPIVIINRMVVAIDPSPYLKTA